LRAEIARSRDQFARDLRVFRREIDIPRKIKRSFQRQTAVWITAAVVVGALLIVLPMRRKTVRIEAKAPKTGKGRGKNKVLEAGFLLGALKFAATVLKPVVVSYVTKKMHSYSGGPQTERRKAAV
jgi:hypothetical protein